MSAPTVPLRVVVVYPDLLGTYGDGGNGSVSSSGPSGGESPRA